MFKWLKSLFSKGKLGVLWKKIFNNAKQQFSKEIHDVENQKKAYEFVKELQSDTTLTNEEKAKKFRLKMLEWAKKCGKILAGSVINCLRELAVNILKDEEIVANSKRSEK